MYKPQKSNSTFYNSFLIFYNLNTRSVHHFINFYYFFILFIFMELISLASERFMYKKRIYFLYSKSNALIFAILNRGRFQSADFEEKQLRAPKYTWIYSWNVKNSRYRLTRASDNLETKKKSLTSIDLSYVFIWNRVRKRRYIFSADVQLHIYMHERPIPFLYSFLLR